MADDKMTPIMDAIRNSFKKGPSGPEVGLKDVIKKVNISDETCQALSTILSYNFAPSKLAELAGSGPSSEAGAFRDKVKAAIAAQGDARTVDNPKSLDDQATEVVAAFDTVRRAGLLKGQPSQHMSGSPDTPVDPLLTAIIACVPGPSGTGKIMGR